MYSYGYRPHGVLQLRHDMQLAGLLLLPLAIPCPLRLEQLPVDLEPEGEWSRVP